jgi:hypothetical protein
VKAACVDESILNFFGKARVFESQDVGVDAILVIITYAAIKAGRQDARQPLGRRQGYRRRCGPMRR